jgi:hypothetical protein
VRHRKIDDQLLAQMLEQGKTQAEAARHFNVSEAAISKRVKRLFPEYPESLNKLTPKEQKFALEVAAGRNQSAAALIAFDASPDSARTIGSRLMAREDVGKAISDIMSEEGLGRRYRIQRLKQHVDSQSADVSLRALDQSFKLDGYIEKHIDVSWSIGDVYELLADLKARKQQLEQGINENGTLLEQD